MTNLINKRATLWFVVFLASVLFAIANLPWHLDEYDQAKQAFTSFEMVTHGNWFYQHTPNGWVATKPPLIGWISAGLFELTRSWELAWRLPSFIAAIVLLFLIARAASVYGAIASVIAASAFSLNLFSPRLATLVRTDMPLALLIFSIGLLIWNGIRQGKLPTTRDRLILFVLLSATMLTKGPIIFAFLLPGILAFQVRARITREPVTAWLGWWPWLASLFIFLVWTVVGIMTVPNFWEHVAVREFAGRFGEVVHRPQPFYFYLPHFLHRFAPWSLLLIVFGLLDLRGKKIRDWIVKTKAETFWLVGWSVGGLLVMSFVPSKRIDRIFPIVPPLCLLLAAQVRELELSQRMRGAMMKCCAISIVIAALLTNGYVLRRVVIAYQEHRDGFARFGALVREEANAHHWSYAVVGGEDEGMALYLLKDELLEPEQAAAEWKNTKLDGLVVPEDELTDLLPRLPGAVPSKIGPSKPTGRYHRRYVFLVRS